VFVPSFTFLYFADIKLARVQFTINHEAKNAGVVHLYAELSQKCYVTGLRLHDFTITI
jgi:hypothetical protein